MKKMFLRQVVFPAVLAILMVGSSGCVYLVVGGVAALGGYAISPDTVEGNITGDNLDNVWQAAVETVSIMGVVEEKDDVSNVVIAKIQGTQVTVSVAEPISNTVKLRVKARKGMMPKIKLAQDVYTKTVQAAH